MSEPTRTVRRSVEALVYLTGNPPESYPTGVVPETVLCRRCEPPALLQHSQVRNHYRWHLRHDDDEGKTASDHA